jgi:uncharacterized protein (TIGR02147 family)
MESIREYLTQELNSRQLRNPEFSMRAFARWLGVSPAQLSQMLAGKRTVTVKTAKKICDRLDLAPYQRRKFFSLTIQDENEAQTKKLKLEEDQFRLISDWHHFAILSLANLPKASSDPRWIARRLNISRENANLALQRLERLGIIQTKPFLKQISDPLDVVSETPSLAIRHYHKQCLNLALEKIDTVSNGLRQYQSLSLLFNPKQMNQFKKLIDDFLENANDLSQSHKGSEVYNLNVQLYPLTQIEETLK